MKRLPIKRKTVRAQYSRTYSWKFKRFWGGDLISVALPTPLVPAYRSLSTEGKFATLGAGKDKLPAFVFRAVSVFVCIQNSKLPYKSRRSGLATTNPSASG